MRQHVENMLRSSGLKLILAAIAVRLLGIFSPYISDESMWADGVKFLSHGVLDPITVSILIHPPLGSLLYLISITLSGMSIASMRIVPLIFGIGVMYLCYLFSREIYDKRIAMITLALIAFSFYPIWTSLYVDLDGSILLFFFTATAFSYYKYRVSDNNDKKYLFFAALSLGLGLLAKYTAIMVIPVLLLAEAMNNLFGRERNTGMFLSSARKIAQILFFGLIIFSIYPIVALLTSHPELLKTTLSYGSNTILTDKIVSQVHSLSSFAISFAKNVFFILQYATPIIPILAILSFRSLSKKENLLFAWIFVSLAFYTFFVPGGGKVRYLTILIPPTYIFAARTLSTFLNVTKKEAASVAFLFLAFFGVIGALNAYGTTETFNFHNLSMQTVTDNGFLWYSGHGSAPFAIHLHSFIFAVALSALLFAVSFRKSYFRNAIFVVLALSMAFNVFILSESFHPTVGPDYEATLKEIAQDYKTTTGPMYGITQFRNAQNAYFGSERLDYFESGVKGKVFVIDVELLDTPLFWESMGKFIERDCRLEKTYYSNGYPFGYVYGC